MEEKKITKNHQKKIQDPNCYKTFASKRGVSANNHTASAASRLDFFLLFLYVVVARTFLFPLVVTHSFYSNNDGALSWNGLRPVTADLTV